VWIKRSFLAILFAVFSVVLLVSQVQSTPVAVPFVSSTQTSQASEALWQALLPIAQQLPQQFKDYQASLSQQTNSLQISNQKLTDNVKSLTESQRLSQEQVATLEDKLTLLQKDLSASTASTIQAQMQAKLAGAELGAFKIGCVTLGVVVVGAGIYELGRYYKKWN
jgi:septal ring factor EnvC (AmiA/AmiB activator)